MAPVAFPTVAWFEQLASLMDEQRERFERLGWVDCTMGVRILDPGLDAEPWDVRVTFEEYGVTEVEEVDPDGVAAADFVLETDQGSWEEMVGSIVAGGGRPDLDHTLNALSLPGVPLRVWSQDPLGKDMFFRYNQSIQSFINNCAEFITVFGDGTEA